MPENTNALTKLKKSQTIPFIGISTVEDGTITWARIGKSTIFDLSFNPNVKTSNYIEDEMPTDEVDYYAPKLPQELATYKGDPAFDYIYDMAYNLPTGRDLIRPALLIFGGNAGTEEDPAKAWLVDATVILNNLNTVDEKILFDLNFGGNIKRGTVVITDGKPAFTENTTVETNAASATTTQTEE